MKLEGRCLCKKIQFEIAPPTAALVSTPTESPDRHVSFVEKVPWLDVCDRLSKYHGKDQLIVK